MLKTYDLGTFLYIVYFNLKVNLKINPKAINEQDQQTEAHRHGQ